MKIERFDGQGHIDIRRVRRYLRQYIAFWRKRGHAHGWPAACIDGGTLPPAAMVVKFRRDLQRSHRQRSWERSVQAQRKRHQVIMLERIRHWQAMERSWDEACQKAGER